MRKERYSINGRHARGRSRKWIILPLILLVLVAGGLIYKFFIAASPVERTINQLQFDDSVTESEKQRITQAITEQGKSVEGTTNVHVNTILTPDNTAHILSAYVPVAHPYAVRQSITSSDLGKSLLHSEIDATTRTAIAQLLNVNESQLANLDSSLSELGENNVALIPVSQLSSDSKLLKLDDGYYLDDFQKGAIFRQVVFSGDDAAGLQDLQLNSLPSKDQVVKVNMTGVTALTRLMQKKLSSVKDPLYFSKDIGPFLADADITHVSNEVSFRTGCQYSNTSFCSPPEFIETLKDSGVDLVELTGNHNNDNGNSYNTDSINLYHGLGMHTFGGGLNTEEARKPYIADMKGSKVAFLAYNMADGAGSGAISGATTAGANIYSDEKAKADIAAAQQSAQFVIVDIQYAECQAYPAGYVEFPECDGPISGQQEDFRNLIDLGADMVIGSSAHQPQTYELYKDKPIYYGLGNLYFEQTQWPGTERGIILTHYFLNGKLLQTKLSPTVYDTAYQTRLMDSDEAAYLLERLNNAR